MEDISEIYKKSERFCSELDEMREEFQKRLHAILYSEDTDNPVAPLKDTTNLTPQPEKKRAKRLSALDEDDENNATPLITRTKNSALVETSAASEENSVLSASRSSKSQKTGKVSINKKTVDTIPKSASELMPPPMAPVTVSSSNSDQSFSRPQRTAKLNCEKNLKEAPLNVKLRRPTNEEMTVVKVKLEKEQRASQMHDSTTTANRIHSMASTSSQDSVVVLPAKELSTVSIASDVEPVQAAEDIEIPENTNQNESNSSGKLLCVRIKREKISISFEQPQSSSEMTQSKAQSKETEAVSAESSVTASILSTTTSNKANTTQNKKGGRKKKAVPKPIKVERLSDSGDDKSEKSVSSRTRNKNKSIEKHDEQVEPIESVQSTKKHDASVYQEALEILPASEDDSGAIKLPTPSSEVVNETITMPKQVVTPSHEINSTMILGTAPNDATYCTASAATFVLETQSSQTPQVEGGDLTFNVAKEKSIESQKSSLQSMATARDTLQPNSDSLITEDESDECPETPVPIIAKKAISQESAAPKVPPKPNGGLLSSAKKLPMPTRACKMPARTIEIFNPLVQSPVKKKVEAYESVAAAQAGTLGAIRKTRVKQIKENTPAVLQSSSTTPLIGKPAPLPLGRFLTPTQSSNVKTPNAVAQAKIAPASASKATFFAKSSSAANLKATSSSSKALSRENSGEDFRKGLHQLAEERKKQREQKHLLAAQQREAKERERAERLAKVAKEREEKRLLKLQESEQRKRELEDIQKKLRAQEEASAAEVAKKRTKILEQEKAKMRELAMANAKERNQPTQPKIQKEYTFEMLHEDDSTDDETKTTYKRPAPPIWSRSHVRGASILKQQGMPVDIVDSFFSVKPMTPDLQTIFPSIDPRHLRRNSSAFWATPPRYSELPKY